jgi:hypothetical protein
MWKVISRNSIHRFQWGPEKENTDTEKLYVSLHMKNGVFWVVTPCGSCKNRRFGGT